MAETNKMEELKISEFKNPIRTLPDRPPMSAQKLKERFDANSEELRVALNALIDLLIGTGGAGDISTAEGISVEKALEKRVRWDGEGIKYVRLNELGEIETSDNGEEWNAILGGHDILDKHGEVVKGTTELQFDQCEVTVEGDRVIVHGIVGPVGPQGDAFTYEKFTEAQLFALIPQLSVGTVTTLEPGKTATVSIGGTKDKPTLSFYIPRGADGAKGADGTSVTVAEVSESTESGGENVVTFSDGKKLTVKNGKDGGSQDVCIITPEKYGAKGDGLTDDSAAIQAAIDNAEKYPVYLAKKNYRISTGLFIRENYTNFKCDGTITYDGVGAAITLTNAIRCVVDVNTISAENGTAIRLDNAEGNVKFNWINVNNIRSSKTGIHLVTTNTTNLQPIYYNEIHFMDIVASEIGVHVEAIGYFINENRYYGGTIGGGCQYGYKIGSEGTQYTTQANKVLFGGLEGISDIGYGIYLKNSEYNIFKNIRTNERFGKYLIGFAGRSQLNSFELPRIQVNEIDISNLGDIGNNNNVIRAMRSSLTEGGATGTEIQINGNYGIVYDTKKSNNLANTIKLSLANFPDGVIKPIDNRIYSSFQSTVGSLNGQTITLGETYYGIASMLKGEPIVFSFGPGTGRIKLVDTDGNTIFDATDGKFDNKTISVKWSGYWGGNKARNLWDVTIEGEYGADGQNGYTPVKGVDYFDGTDGKDGTSVTVSSVNESTADGGNNVVTFSDGKTLTVKNGSKGDSGEKGDKGNDGYSPVKSTDYWTDADKEEIVNAVYAKVANGNEVAY